MFLPKLSQLAYKKIAKPLFFKVDPERMHDRMKLQAKLLGSNSLSKALVKATLAYSSPSLNNKVAGINFANPIGLSCGFDKDADFLPLMGSVGFGFSQVGSVTIQPYAGNNAKRLYRLPKSQALIVNYGLKNIGTAKVLERIAQYGELDIPFSVSVAKTNSAGTVSQSEAIADYIASLQLVMQSSASMITINVSCPNTFGGEPFTTPAKLTALLTEVDRLNITQPVFIKMPVDLSWDETRKLLDVIVEHRVAGVILSNLTKSRNNKLIIDDIPDCMPGGISGKPTQALSDALITSTYKHYGNKLAIIGVGGVFNAQDAWRKVTLGASLVQLITGMIYEGPQLIGQINCGLDQLLRKNGFKSIADVVGSANK